MKPKRRQLGVHPAWLTLGLVVSLVVAAIASAIAYNRDFTSYASATLTSDRAGLVMEPYAKVKYRGIQVGRVSSIQPNNPVQLELEMYSDQLQYIPANVQAQITAPTAFGAKYVELVPPDSPSSQHLAPGARLTSNNVSIEVNTVFKNLSAVLNQIDPAKLNAVLSALAEGFRGKGEAMGQAITDFNQVLQAVNPRNETIRADFRSFKEFADAYSAAAPDLIKVLDAGSTVGTTVANNAKALDSLLLNISGLSSSGIDLIGPNSANLVHGINALEPTTRLLMKYNPILTCTLIGGHKLITDYGWPGFLGGHDGKALEVSAGLLFGDDPYRYPDNLPVTGQKGGPGGTPSCGSLPDVAQNWPVRFLITNSGYGSGMDIRPNPGIGFPGFENFLPTTRGTPEAPSVHRVDGPAPGPVPYPGAPPYGAKWYDADGTPLYPGLPTPPPPGRFREVGPPAPGSEPFTPAHPGSPVTPAPSPSPPPPPLSAPAPLPTDGAPLPTDGELLPAESAPPAP